MNDQTKAAIMRKARNWLANVPVLSLLLFRYWVLYGSTVVDWSFTRAGADKRARAFVYAKPRPLQAWNSIQVQRCRTRARKNGSLDPRHG